MATLKLEKQNAIQAFLKGTDSDKQLLKTISK